MASPCACHACKRPASLASSLDAPTALKRDLVCLCAASADAKQISSSDEEEHERRGTLVGQTKLDKVRETSAAPATLLTLLSSVAERGQMNLHPYWQEYAATTGGVFYLDP